MSSVTAQHKEGSPETLVIVATAVAHSPVKRPTFRIRNSKTKEYVAPGGYQTGIHEFSWDVVRDGETLTFSGPLEAFGQIGAEDPLTLEIPAVGYSARFQLSPKAKPAKAEQPRPSVDVRNPPDVQFETKIAEVEPEFSPLGAETIASMGAAAKVEADKGRSAPPTLWPSGWLILLALSTVGALVFAGWKTFEASTLTVELAGVQSRHDNAVAALESANISLAGASSERDKANRVLVSLESERNAARRQAESLAGDLKREQTAHQATRAQLAEVKKLLDAGVMSTTEQTTSSFANLELERNAARRKADVALADFEREAKAHQETRDRLAELQKQLDAERAAARSVSAQPSQTSSATSAPLAQSVHPTGQNAGVTECDRLAANPTDARRASPELGMRWPDLKRIATAASIACKEALDSYPKEQRLLYQLGRAIVAGGDDETPKELFEQLAKLGYPAACDNAATYYAKRGRWKEAESFYRQGVALGDLDSMIALADAIRGHKLPASRFGEADELYDRAASLGHKGAQADVDQRRKAGSVIDHVGSYFWPNMPRR